ncbi:nickel ABC transporter substrate-binding protein [Methanosarcina mazei]|uniref:Nickel ABC transporter substrate-binding protein n=1 Tax=Methanosarcina mazei TaxID=2209 RepID=A0A0F8S2K3_METMZ|nr:nickel ABC transporter substrate-binding protein [Methanosarcina mazei]KKG75801.1 nickel ABC transporter substrate-binding protein [Methanosarcina mazei]KKH34253.1 nickel ABC transporter substrate-binding protein [Methanosarcina mazei]KKH39132.1 nickel ABC transporter substrate-binding protein [Methanosarcina mazei]KKH43741.1 nickel ABC transporter substrate-binding protein [Methanosarcina mazei]
MLIGSIIIVIAAAIIVSSMSSPAADSEPTEQTSQVAGETALQGSEELSSPGSDELVAAVGTHGGEPETGFNPITGWGNSREPLVQSTLFKRDSEARLINDLAANYTVSSDGLKWTVTIRDDVKFHDGMPLTAEDVAFTFNTAANAGGSIDLSMLEKATATDDYTVEFEMNDPQSTFINKLVALGIVPEHAYNAETYGSSPIGSGPYKFVQWDKGQQVIFEANQDYYGQEPYFKKLTMLFMGSDSAFAAAKAGQVDLAEIPSSYAYQTVDGMKIVSLDSIDARGISFPMNPNTGEKTENGYVIGNDVTSDPAIRKALNIGIDRQALVDGALNGQGEEEFTGVDKLPWGNKEAIFEDGDIEGAKKILAEGGWTDTDGDGIVEKKGLKAEFTLLYPANAQERQALAVSMSEEAKKLGINIKVEGKSWDEIYTLCYSTPNVWGYGSLDPTDIYLRYYSKSYDPSTRNNVIMYNNPAVDNYLRTAITSPDQETANKNWQLAAWDGTTGFSAEGDASWMWMATINYVYIMDEDLDIGTPKIQPHGADIFGSILEWKRA